MGRLELFSPKTCALSNCVGNPTHQKVLHIVELRPLESDFSRIAFNPTCAAATTTAAAESSGNSRRLRGKEREGQVCVVVGSPGRGGGRVEEGGGGGEVALYLEFGKLRGLNFDSLLLIPLLGILSSKCH